MKRNNLIIIILFSVLALLLLVYFIFTGQEEKHYQWSENYKIDNDQPYGMMFIKKLLESYRPGEEFILNDKKPLRELLDSASLKGPTDYIFIGKTIYLDDVDGDALLKFIRAGNDAFICSYTLPGDLAVPLFESECGRNMYLENHEQNSATLNFYHPTLHTKNGYKYSYHLGSSEPLYSWYALNSEVFCDSTQSVIPLGYIDPDYVNFFKLPYGNGNLYIHTNPIVFTNYFLAEPDKAAYAEGILSHLKGKTIIFDEYSRSQSMDGDEPRTSPLSYILQHKSLKYAWWLMLGSVLLYTFFAAKRKQRSIPVLEGKVNTSLEFVKMVSALHFQNGNNLDIARKKMKYFLHFIRTRYGIHTQNFEDASMIRLAEKSKVDLYDIQFIFNKFKQVDNHFSLDSETLMTLYNAIEKFYKHCK